MAKFAQMAQHPTEEEKISISANNLLPMYHSHMFANYYPNFKHLINSKNQIENAINNEMIKGKENKFKGKPYFFAKVIEDN